MKSVVSVVFLVHAAQSSCELNDPTYCPVKTCQNPEIL